MATTTLLHRFFGRSQSSLANELASSPARNSARTALATPRSGLPQRIVNPTELPTWKRNRTATGGDMPSSVADRKFAAVLDCGRDGHLLLFAPGPHTGRVIAGLETLLNAEKSAYTRCATTPEILEIVYDNITVRPTESDTNGDVGEDKLSTLFEELLRGAVVAEASDIHIEVGPGRTCILMRVHGDLKVVRHLSLLKGKALARHIFVNANVSGVDFNPEQFQDAKIAKTVVVGGEAVDLELRFADMPTYPSGFDVTLRVLRSGVGKTRSIESLGYDPNQQAAIDRMLQSRTGLIVMCGSTGSGKSTTLGSLLHVLALRHGGAKKIRTIEDPPELVLPGRQTPVVRDANGKSQGFAAALRAAMRGDPDIIMIGEVRDNETGELVMDAAMTGHKVLTTVHGGSPFDAVDRLVKKGFDRSVLFAEGNLSGVIYQCLLPVLCPECSISFAQARLSIPEGLRMRLRSSFSGDVEALRFRGVGCEDCKHESIIGRTVCASFLVPDRRLRELLLENNRFAAEAYWIENEWSGKFAANGRTVLDQALEKMGLGQVSPADVELELAPIDSQEPRESNRPVARVVR